LEREEDKVVLLKENIVEEREVLSVRIKRINILRKQIRNKNYFH
jgi:hypothetical protein